MSGQGASFGKYFLTEKLATGGMAEIFLAKLFGPGGFEKQLVIKQIHPELSNQRHFVDLFVAEAKTLVSLSHANVVPVYELGVVNGTYFLAMEYIDGPTLSDFEKALRKRDESVTPTMAAFIAAEIVKGLEYAHRKGDSVIHRDLSARNVMISREGEVKLVDFGLAVTVEGQPGSGGRGDGRPVGSFPYMSPEQVRREALDGRSDLFSAGILLWEMLTGESLFARDDADETLEAVLTAAIPAPSSRNSEVPAHFDDICSRALERDIEGRYQTAGEFVADLNRFLYSLDAPVSASDLSALVSRACPMVRARRDSTVSSEPESEDGVDRTRPMEGRKRRAATKTFATNANFKGVLLNATPLLGIEAVLEEEAAATRETAPPAKKALWPAILGAAVFIAVLSVGWFLAANQAPAITIDAGGADAAVPLDAANTPPDATMLDASVPDAGRIDAAPKPRGKGTLRVGAMPWGVVYVDGKKVGQAPGSFQISAGPHRVEVRHPPSGGRRSFSIRVRAGKTKNVGMVNFSSR